jgi:molybdenum cofactor biosynthesis enzyme MoaA
VGVIAPFYDGWPCIKECRRIRIGPGGRAKICVMDKKNYELKGLSYQEKLKMFREMIKERKRWDRENLFPAKHIPAFSELRFGIVE